ncbi:MAG: 30S ribosomal protein S8 [Verrucomicrobia bacterium]|nr:30S ribosomal protein S8 [Verrucomicrobiota bacterium]MBU6446028.1 30S ribosomal protein S8 [Verrucomicrobiota bacterium]MDE3046762.1 30S ribosomal protein S8 [Verrucomicrobiota bacterium]
MAFNDPIAELLTKIRNARGAQHRYVDLGHSRMKVKILEILKNHGFIENFLVNEEQHKIRIFLRYTKSRESVIHGLDRISRSGLRRYVGYIDIPKVFNGMGVAILSTPKGILDGETARNLKVGGELLCKVW